MKTILTAGLLAGAAVFGFAGGGADDVDAAPDFNPDLNFAQVVQVAALLESTGRWSFSVTVRHNDEGWEHYAGLWEVIDPETAVVLGRRVLAHPHDNEQPFSRSQSGIVIPAETTVVLVRAKCTKHGFEGKAVLVDLSIPEGFDFTVRK